MMSADLFMRRNATSVGLRRKAPNRFAGPQLFGLVRPRMQGNGIGLYSTCYFHLSGDYFQPDSVTEHVRHIHKGKEFVPIQKQ